MIANGEFTHADPRYGRFAPMHGCEMEVHPSLYESVEGEIPTVVNVEENYPFFLVNSAFDDIRVASPQGRLSLTGEMSGAGLAGGDTVVSIGDLPFELQGELPFIRNTEIEVVHKLDGRGDIHDSITLGDINNAYNGVVVALNWWGMTHIPVGEATRAIEGTPFENRFGAAVFEPGEPVPNIFDDIGGRGIPTFKLTGLVNFGGGLEIFNGPNNDTLYCARSVIDYCIMNTLRIGRLELDTLRNALGLNYYLSDLLGHADPTVGAYLRHYSDTTSPMNGHDFLHGAGEPAAMAHARHMPLLSGRQTRALIGLQKVYSSSVDAQGDRSQITNR